VDATVRLPVAKDGYVERLDECQVENWETQHPTAEMFQAGSGSYALTSVKVLALVTQWYTSSKQEPFDFTFSRLSNQMPQSVLEQTFP
jgi:hypothetical protein